MTQKERLIKLLDKRNLNYLRYWGSVDEIAEYLINNGIVVPPCKLGDTVYEACAETIWHNDYKRTYHIERYVRAFPFTMEVVDAIGETVFLTFEEAEAALEGVDQ